MANSPRVSPELRAEATRRLQRDFGSAPPDARTRERRQQDNLEHINAKNAALRAEPEPGFVESMFEGLGVLHPQDRATARAAVESQPTGPPARPVESNGLDPLLLGKPLGDWAATRFGGAIPINRMPPEAYQPPAPDESLAVPDGDVLAEARRDPRGAMGKAAGTMAATATGMVATPLLAAGLGAVAPFAAAGGAGTLLPAVGGSLLSGAAGRATDAAVTGREPVMDAVLDPEAAKADAFLAGLPYLAGTTAGAVPPLLRKDKWIGQYARAKEAGVYKQPEMKNLPRREEGIEAASKVGLDRTVARDQQLANERGGRYAGRVNPRLRDRVEGQDIVSDLNRSRLENIDPDTGYPLVDAIDDQFVKQIDRTPAKPTIEGTLARRRALKKEGSFGNRNPTPGQEAARDSYQAFRKAVRVAAPDVGAADDEFSRSAAQAARRRDILFNTEDEVIARGGDLPEPQPIEHADELLEGAPQSLADNPLRVGKEKAAVTTMGRVGDENVPGLRTARYLEELADQDPEFRAALKFIMDKKALEATRLSPKGVLATDLRGATALWGALPAAQQTARAVGARLIDPTTDMFSRAATAVGRAAPVANPNPIVRSHERDRERQRELSRKARGGK